MGLSSAPRIFTEFMHFPIWAIKNDRKDLYYIDIDANNINKSHFNKDSDITYLPQYNKYRIALIFNYLDDILGGHTNEQSAWDQYYHSETILKRLSLKTKFVKGRPPNQIQTWLGKEYNTILQWLKLPDDKYNKYIKQLIAVKKLQYISAKNLLSIIGKARHMGTIYRPLNAFARGLEKYVYTGTPKIDLTKQIHLSKALIRDLEFLMYAMEQANKFGVPFTYFVRPLNKPDIICYTDASLTVGIGGVASSGHYIQQKWSDINLINAHKKDIVWREMCAIFVLLYALREELKDAFYDKILHIYTDNEPCKWMLINMRAQLYRPDVQELINYICKLLIDYRIQFWIDHIPGKQNVIADALSRYINLPTGNSVNKCKHYIPTKHLLQWASRISEQWIVSDKYLKFVNDDY